MYNNKICAFTADNPSQFDFTFNESDSSCVNLKFILANQILRLIESGVTTFLSGLTVGVDLWCAEIVNEFKNGFPQVNLIAVIPSEIQLTSWSNDWQERYFNVLSNCDDKIYIKHKYSSFCIIKRNNYLVHNSDILLAIYNGDDLGSTAYTVKHANQKGMEIITIDHFGFEFKL